jgi:hypothetical protein
LNFFPHFYDLAVSFLISTLFIGMALERPRPSEPHLLSKPTGCRLALSLFLSLQSELGLIVVPYSHSSRSAGPSATPTTSPQSLPVSQHYHYPYKCSSVAVQSPTLAQARGKPELSLFVPFKQSLRWVERLLWRAIVQTPRVYDIRTHEGPIADS